MEAELTLCINVLTALCDGLGTDDPISRRAACLELCGTESKYNQVITRLASQCLLDIVYVPSPATGREVLYPVLYYGTLKLVKASTARSVLTNNLAPVRRQ